MILPTSERAHIAIATCVWRRPHLTRAMLEYYKRAAEALDSHGVVLTGAVAGSEDDDLRSPCLDAGFLYTSSPNRPLAKKWNAAVALLREQRPDAVLVIGSDDWLSHGMLSGYARLLRDGHDHVSLCDLYLLDAETRRCSRFRGLTGVGCMLRRDVVERLQWQLWPEQLNRSLDNGMKRRLSAMQPGVSKPWIGEMAEVGQDATAIDVKTSTNLWNFDRLSRSEKCADCSPQEALRHFSDLDLSALEFAMQQECANE